MGWGSDWDKEIKINIIPPSEGLPADQWGNSSGVTFKEMTKAEFEKCYGVDLAQPGTDQTILTTFEDGKFTHRVIPTEELYKNLKPTHDPYTNPKATIYYECGCGAILDPQTKSFAALNNYASEKGWKIRFGSDGYTPYCVKCGEDVE